MKVLKSTLAIVTAAAVLGVSGFAQAGATLDAVQKKGFVQCGVSDGLPGFSVPDASGKILGIDADVCRAVAAAVFGDATKVKFSQLNAKERFTALQSGEVDILSRNTTMTSSRDAGMGLYFWLGLGLACVLVVYQFGLARGREREACFRAFLHNNWVGMVIFAGIAADFALRTKAAAA